MLLEGVLDWIFYKGNCFSLFVVFEIDMDLAEVQNLRTRVHQTVIMGQGTSASAKLSELEDGGNDIVLAKPSSKAEQYHKCNQCGNNDQGDVSLRCFISW